MKNFNIIVVLVFIIISFLIVSCGSATATSPDTDTRTVIVERVRVTGKCSDDVWLLFKDGTRLESFNDEAVLLERGDTVVIVNGRIKELRFRLNSSENNKF